MPGQHSSVTHEISRREVMCFVLLRPPPSSQLALRSDISKLDCTGQKVDNLRNHWAYIAVFGLISKQSGRAMQ